MKDRLIKGASEYGISLSESQADNFIKYMDLLVEWNEKINLTAITQPEEIITKHFLDCLSVFSAGYVKEEDCVIDVGTGAGFPGMVMKLAKPKINLTLLDSLNKRIGFLKTVSEESGLGGISFVHSRAEDGGNSPLYREKFDVAIARAVANMSTLSEYLLPFVKVGGYFIAMKGPLADEELQSAQNAISVLGGKLQEVVEVNVPFTDLHHKIVIVKKIKPCPKGYPRKAGTPSKKPL